MASSARSRPRPDEADSFNLDWSLHLESDKAVKSGYAGFDWDEAAFQEKFQSSKEQLGLRESLDMAPGGLASAEALAALDTLTYEARSTRSMRLPGALLSALKLTL